MGRPRFAPKRIGWGRRPVTWQGWLVTVVPLAVVIVIVRFVVR
jgi:hypothetical protein